MQFRASRSEIAAGSVVKFADPSVLIPIRALSKPSVDFRTWRPQDSAELYQIQAWGRGFYSVDEAGEVVVHPMGPSGRRLSIKRIIDDLKKRGYSLPVLLRFSDVLHERVDQLCGSFSRAMEEYGYSGTYRPVYPIKVNQQRDVVEELVEFGRTHNLGLEAGSKPELLISLAHMDNPEALIICNGYKDRAYVETALLAQKLGRHTIIVVDRFDELEMILSVGEALDLRPHIGVRARLSTRGAGRWSESTGDRSKFGLSADELVRVIRRLEDVGMVECLELLHFHIGSQITAIRAIKDALKEAGRIFTELCGLGAGLKFLDVGGGLGVDYDGSKSNFHSSTNYTLQEYANDVVWAVQEVCDERGLPHPDIVSESGRALVAHHSVLVADVLGQAQVAIDEPEPELAEHESPVIREMYETWQQVSRKRFHECYHDALEQKEKAGHLFKLGYLDLVGRATTEKLFWAICHRILWVIKQLDRIPEELQNLERALCDTYYCNFSVFQSMPDHWAVKQLFPVMPLHRLGEEPTRRAILADLTCDSDGKVDQFVDLHDVKHSLELHPLRCDEDYYLGFFLVGAYQEILGDLHNLFGDTHVMHVSLEEEGYELERVVEGDSISDVLGYVQYGRQELVRRVRQAAERGVRKGKITLEESALLLRRYDEALSGYTYLRGADA